MIIGVQHCDLQESTLYINGEFIGTRTGIEAEWEITQPGEICITFQPWKIKPIIRIDNFLINHWLANVLLEDHAVTFLFATDFFTRYREKDLQGRLNSLGTDPALITIDRVIGRNLHEDMVEKIKTRLREKSNIS